MYLNHYGLQEEPFGVTPDPRFLYTTHSYRVAQSTLEHGIACGRGFTALVAAPGLGKTTLLFHLLERYSSTARTAFLFLTQCNARDFLRSLMSQLGAGTQETDVAALQEQLGELLRREAEAGRKVIVVVDEAHNLEPSVLETVRLLSDFETPRAKLLHIILSGQAELADKLAAPALRQRISHVARLKPLNGAEVRHYIEHRLRVAGYSGAPLFTREARTEILQRSQGVPRLVNNLCFQALSRACELKRKTVDGRILAEISGEVDWEVREEETSSQAPAVSISEEELADGQQATVAGNSARPVNGDALPLVAAASTAMMRLPGADSLGQSPKRPESSPTLGPVLVPMPSGSTGAAAAGPVNGAAGSVSSPAAAGQQVEEPPKPAIDVEALAFDCALFEMEAPKRWKRPEGKAAALNSPGAPMAARARVRPPSATTRRSAPPAAGRANPRPAPEPAQPVRVMGKAAEGAVQPARSGAAMVAPHRDRILYVAAGASLLLLLLMAWLLGTSGSPASSQEPDAETTPRAAITANQPVASSSVAPESSPSDRAAPDSATPDSATPDSTTLDVTQELARGAGRSSHPAVVMRRMRAGEELLHRVDPVYPAAALENHIEGPVVLEATISSHGFLRHIRVLNGNALLANAVLDAVQGWSYQPRRVRGRAVETETRIVVNFQLSGSAQKH